MGIVACFSLFLSLLFLSAFSVISLSVCLFSPFFFIPLFFVVFFVPLFFVVFSVSFFISLIFIVFLTSFFCLTFFVIFFRFFYLAGALFFVFFVPPVCFFSEFFVRLPFAVLYCCVYALFFSRKIMLFFCSLSGKFLLFCRLYFLSGQFLLFYRCSSSLPLSLSFALSLFSLFLLFALFSFSRFFFLRDTATSNALRLSTFRRFLYLCEKTKRKKLDCRREKLFLRYVISKILVIFRGFAVLKSHKFESLFGGHLFRAFFRLSYAFADAIGV